MHWERKKLKKYTLGAKIKLLSNINYPIILAILRKY